MFPVPPVVPTFLSVLRDLCGKSRSLVFLRAPVVPTFLSVLRDLYGKSRFPVFLSAPRGSSFS